MSFSTLVSCATLAEHLNDPDWRIFDCRHQLADLGYGEQAYAAGHLPGAFFLHLDRDLSSPMNGRNGRHPLPDPALLAQKLGLAGVTDKTQVVVYDDAGGMVAARLWWLLRWLGHARVALLDGGLPRWVGQGRPLSREAAHSAPAVFSSDGAARQGSLVSADEILASMDASTLCLIDARAPDRFHGENETLDPVAGHIPGARNRFFRDNLDGDGSFRSPAELRSAFSALLAGAGPSQTAVYCGSGVSACHNLLAMEIAGLSGAQLYAGSWSEWCTDRARPVAS